MLDNTTQAVSMGCNEDVLAGFDLRDNDLIPEGQGACNGVLQTLTGGQLTLLQTLIAPRLVVKDEPTWSHDA